MVEELEHDIFDPIEIVQEEKNAAILKHMPVRERWDSQMSWKTEVSIPGPDLFDLILYVSSTIFQLYRDGSSWVEPVLS